MDPFIPNSELDIDTTYVGDESIIQSSHVKSKKKVKITEKKQADVWARKGIEIKTEPYLERSRLLVPLPTNEASFFQLFITDYIINFLVQETNKYAEKILTNEEFLDFILINAREMKHYICLLIYMGINDLPSYEMYWKQKDNPFYNDFCGRLLKYERFTEIKRFFHVFDNQIADTLQSQNVNFSKLDGLILYFNKKFSQVYIPEKEISVDENMCAWSGNGGSKVYMPLKPVKYGIKLYALCESKSGYACSLIQYNSRKSESNVEMISRLTTNYQHKNHHLYMDNFYTSLKVVEKMSELGIYCCGTLRDNRGGPKNLKQEVKKLLKGEGYIFNNNSVNCLGMMDNGPVALISSIHSCATQGNSSNEKQQNLHNSTIIKDYNKYMGGVDLMDQMTGYYAISRRSKKWTTKLCYHIFNIAFHNSYVLYKKYSTCTKKKTYLKYLIKVIYLLAGDVIHSTLSQDTITQLQPTNLSTPSSRVTHYPVELANRRQCVVCSTHKKRKEIKTMCSSCQVALCCIGCFAEYHNTRDDL